MQWKSVETKIGAKEEFDSTGDRTQNLWFRRPAPYPLGHGVLLVVSYI